MTTPAVRYPAPVMQALCTADLPSLFEDLAEMLDRATVDNHLAARELRLTCLRGDVLALALVKRLRRGCHDTMRVATQVAQAALYASQSPCGAGETIAGIRHRMILDMMVQARSLGDVVAQAAGVEHAVCDDRRDLLLALSQMLLRPAPMRLVEERKRRVLGNLDLSF